MKQQEASDGHINPREGQTPWAGTLILVATNATTTVSTQSRRGNIAAVPGALRVYGFYAVFITSATLRHFSPSPLSLIPNLSSFSLHPTSLPHSLPRTDPVLLSLIDPRANRLCQSSEAIKVKAQLTGPARDLRSLSGILLGDHHKDHDRRHLADLRVDQDRTLHCLYKLEDFLEILESNFIRRLFSFCCFFLSVGELLVIDKGPVGLLARSYVAFVHVHKYVQQFWYIINGRVEE